MLSFTSLGKIYVYAAPADMRKGVDGLSGVVRGEFAIDPTDGSLFVFLNRRRDRMKILHFDGGGYWLFYRVLEAGTFEMLTGTNDLPYVTIDATQLAMLLSGISLAATTHRRRRFSLPTTPQKVA